jgi:phosphatidylglycerophosphatase C
MGSMTIGRQGPDARPIVAFDFDGTLSFRDSFLAFLAWRSGPARWMGGMIALLPATLLYMIHRDRGRLKAAAARRFLRGLTRAELEAACDNFASSSLGQRLIRPDAEQCWTRWREHGAELVIVTASPEEVVAPFARRLGADRLIGTRLGYDEAGRVEGGFASPNCRGPEKVARLKAVYGEDVRLAAAYGDTAGDREMLALADEPDYRVFTQRSG